jgi:hypothetical protein
MITLCSVSQLMQIVNADLGSLVVGVLQCLRGLDYLGRLVAYTLLPPLLTVLMGLLLTPRRVWVRIGRLCGLPSLMDSWQSAGGWCRTGGLVGWSAIGARVLYVAPSLVMICGSGLRCLAYRVHVRV